MGINKKKICNLKDSDTLSESTRKSSFISSSGSDSESEFSLNENKKEKKLINNRKKVVI